MSLRIIKPADEKIDEGNPFPALFVTVTSVVNTKF